MKAEQPCGIGLFRNKTQTHYSMESKRNQAQNAPRRPETAKLARFSLYVGEIMPKAKAAQNGNYGRLMVFINFIRLRCFRYLTFQLLHVTLKNEDGQTV